MSGCVARKRKACIITFLYLSSSPAAVALRGAPLYPSWARPAPSLAPFLFRRQIRERGGVMTIKSKDCSQFASSSLPPRRPFFIGSSLEVLLHAARARFRPSCRYTLARDILPGFFSPVLGIVRISRSLILNNCSSSYVIQYRANYTLNGVHEFSSIYPAFPFQD